MRKSVALIVAAGLLVALAGCSSSSDAASGCTTTVSAGAASNLISATTDPTNPAGTFGTAPTLTVNTPLDTPTTEMTTLIKGTGPVLPANGVVSFDFALVDGTTGEAINKSTFDGKSYAISPVSQLGIPGLESALACVTQGSRLAIAIPASETSDPSTSGSTSTQTDSLALIVDVISAIPERADGAVQPAQAGFPSVALGPDGRPGITIPSGAVPTTASSAVLKKGDGATIATGDGVWVQYTSVSWTDKTVLSSTWEAGAPTQIVAASDGSSAVPDLVGQTVGSQYISVVPGTASSTGSGTSSPTIFVVDVLGVTPVVQQTQ